MLLQILQIWSKVYQNSFPWPPPHPTITKNSPRGPASIITVPVPVLQKPCSLQAWHLALDVILHLARQLALHVLLQHPEQERPKHSVQPTTYQYCFFFTKLNLLSSNDKWIIEPLFQCVTIHSKPFTWYSFRLQFTMLEACLRTSSVMVWTML